MWDTRYLQWTWWRDTLCFKVQSARVSAALGGLSAVFLLSAHILLLYRRCTSKESSSRDKAAYVLYWLLGDLSGTLGAILSNQLDVQVFMGVFMTALDVVNICFIIFPICLCWHSYSARRMKIIMRKRRRQNLLVASLPLALGACFCFRPYLKPMPAVKAHSNRRLLDIFLQDNGDFLGYTLGFLSFIIGWTSRLPVLAEALQGEISSGLHISYGVLCALASLLYASAILLYDTRVEPIQKALLWILTATGCAAFDVVIITLSCYRKQKEVRVSFPLQRGTSPDTQCLLSSSSCALHCPRGRTSGKHNGHSETSLQVLRGNKYINRKTDVGCYMDISIQPAEKEVKKCYEDQSGRTVKLVQVNSPCSSGSSMDSLSISSDLEWDFEDVNSHWCDTHKQVDSFALQTWTDRCEHKSGDGNIAGEANRKACANVCICDAAIQKAAQ